MDLSAVVSFHQQGWAAALMWFPILVFVIIGEVLILLQSKQLTRRRSGETVLTTALAFLIVFWGLSLLPGNMAEKGSLGLELSTVVFFIAVATVVRGVVAALISSAGMFWSVLASVPLPLFVYFTAWVAIK